MYLSEKWNIPFNSVKTGVVRLIEIGILHEVPGRKKKKLFIARQLMELLTATAKKALKNMSNSKN